MNPAAFWECISNSNYNILHVEHQIEAVLSHVSNGLIPRPTLSFALWLALTIIHGSGRVMNNGDGLGEFIT